MGIYLGGWRASASNAVGWTLASLLLLSDARAAHAQSTAAIAGTVKDITGSPLADVVIAVSGATTLTTRTSDDGLFRLGDLPSGRYDIAATLHGFVTSHVTVELEPGSEQRVSLTLSLQYLEQTIVTASRVGASDLQATPMAVSVLPATELTSTQTHTMGQLSGLAPSVTFSQNSDFAQLTIRGIGSNVVFAGSDPSSALYLDGVYMARPVMAVADFLDLERVEVLRGPQGTLYGRNAVGGAVNLITRPPGNQLETSADSAAGSYDTWRMQARISGPLVPNRILASAAMLRGVRNGFVRDTNHPDHPLGSEDVIAVRAQALFAINRTTSVLVSADGTRQDPTPLTYAKVLAVKPGFQIDNPVDLHEVRASTPAHSDIAQHGISARVTWSVTPTTMLTSLSAFRNLDYELLSDADITELELVTSNVHETQRQFSEELTVAYTGPRLTWIGGLFLFDERDRQPTIVGLGAPRLVNWLLPQVDARASALFGQATVAVLPRASITAGIRYSDERKSIENAGRLTTMDPPHTTVIGSEYEYSDSIRYSAWTPRVGFEVQARENLLAYVSAARGFKSGGFNLTSTEPGRGYAPESAWSYEAGLKSDVAERRARLNVSVFVTDYKDLQVQTPIRPGVLDISNAAVATIRGAELEGSIAFTSAAKAGGHLAWLDARYDRYIAVGTGGISGDVAGHRLSNSPQWSGHVWFQWSRGIGSHLLSVRPESRWQTTVFFTPFNDVVQRQRSYGVIDLGAQFGPRSERWSLGVYARNLTNQDYITGTFASPPPAIGGRPGEPRNVGVQLRVRR